MEERPEQLKKGNYAIFNGGLWAPRRIMRECIIKNKNPNRSTKSTHHLLTSREVEILQMVAAGYSNPKIAEELCISLYTVKTHLSNIFMKIKAPSRLQAAFWAVKNL